MADPNIRIKRSSVAGKRPTISQVDMGELALNTNDGRLFTRKYNVGIGSTVTLLTPWTENIGGGVYYNEGNVGLGTTNPTAKLDVDGDVNVSGVVTASTGTLISGVEIKNDGVSIGTTITILDFTGTGISTATSSVGIVTINIEGGGGSSTPDISPVMMGMIF